MNRIIVWDGHKSVITDIYSPDSSNEM